MRQIDADALLNAYDAQHKGPPGAARRLIETAPTVGGWISVKDRLPEATEPDANGEIALSKMVLVYLVYDDGFTYQTVDTCCGDKWLHEVPGEGCRVTHWMPLPEPPKERDENDATDRR